MKKMQAIMAVLVLTGCLLAQGCTLVSKQTKGDVTKIGLFSADIDGDPEYIFAFYDGNVSGGAFSLIQLYED